jgi:hypothetical protein
MESLSNKRRIKGPTSISKNFGELKRREKVTMGKM